MSKADDPLEQLTYKSYTLAELWDRARQYIRMSDDFEHEIWEGPLQSSGSPTLTMTTNYKKTTFSVRQLAYRVQHLTNHVPQILYHDSSKCDNEMCISHNTTSRERKSFADDELVVIGDKTYRLGGVKKKLAAGARKQGDCLLFPQERVVIKMEDGTTSSVSPRKLAYALEADDPTDIPWALTTTCGQSYCIYYEHLVDRWSDEGKEAEDREGPDPKAVVEALDVPSVYRGLFQSTWEHHQGDIIHFKRFVSDLARWAMTGDVPS